MRVLKNIILLSFLLLFINCNPQADFLHHYQIPESEQISRIHSIKELSQDHSSVDILWIIDNSGSMGSFQRSVVANTQLFMDEFIKIAKINWRMGLISTDVQDTPYIGFQNNGGYFDFNSPNPVQQFQAAVNRLGINGDGWERTLDPIINSLQQDPHFLRPNSWTVFILVTDEDEQSTQTVDEFINSITKFISPAYLKTYAAFGASDIGCSLGAFTYKNSKFEEFMNKTHGLYFPACSVNFGLELAKIGKDIVTHLSRPRIILEKRPRPQTIVVNYKGNSLPGGVESTGAYWYYDYNQNAVVFYSLDFAPGDKEEVQITFTEDNGY